MSFPVVQGQGTPSEDTDSQKDIIERVKQPCTGNCAGVNELSKADSVSKRPQMFGLVDAAVAENHDIQPSPGKRSAVKFKLEHRMPCQQIRYDDIHARRAEITG